MTHAKYNSGTGMVLGVHQWEQTFVSVGSHYWLSNSLWYSQNGNEIQTLPSTFHVRHQEQKFRSVDYAIDPTGKKTNGTPYYTLPAIHGPSTNTYLADSFTIAEYLEKTYPDTPSIFPHKTVSLQHTFMFALTPSLTPVQSLIIPPRLGQSMARSLSTFIELENISMETIRTLMHHVRLILAHKSKW